MRVSERTGRRWRRYCDWLPLQPCFVCDRLYWGGFPYPDWAALARGRLAWQWKPGWMEYCSRKCADLDYELTERLFG